MKLREKEPAFLGHGLGIERRVAQLVLHRLGDQVAAQIPNAVYHVPDQLLLHLAGRLRNVDLDRPQRLECEFEVPHLTAQHGQSSRARAPCGTWLRSWAANRVPAGLSRFPPTPADPTGSLHVEHSAESPSAHPAPRADSAPRSSWPSTTSTPQRCEHETNRQTIIRS